MFELPAHVGFIFLYYFFFLFKGQALTGSFCLLASAPAIFWLWGPLCLLLVRESSTAQKTLFLLGHRYQRASTRFVCFLKNNLKRATSFFYFLFGFVMLQAAAVYSSAKSTDP